MNRVLKAVAAAALLGAAGSAGAVTQIVNGSFEDGVAIPDGSFVTLGGGSNGIFGWTVGNRSFGVDYVGTYWQAADGERSVDLSALNTGAIWQDITTEVGRDYQITFFMAGNPDGGPGPRALTVSIDGEQPQYEVFTVTGDTSRADMGWEQRLYTFTAFSTTTRLVFASNERTPFGPAIDNVNILDGGGNPLPVPEPATWAMLIAGFGLVGAVARRRRTSVAA